MSPKAKAELYFYYLKTIIIGYVLFYIELSESPVDMLLVEPDCIYHVVLSDCSLVEAGNCAFRELMGD